MNYDNNIQSTLTDELGMYKIAIPGENKDLENLRLLVGENLIYKPFRKNLDFSENLKQKTNRNDKRLDSIQWRQTFV